MDEWFWTIGLGPALARLQGTGPTGSAPPSKGACLSWGGMATSNLTPRLAASAETRFIGG